MTRTIITADEVHCIVHQMPYCWCLPKTYEQNAAAFTKVVPSRPVKVLPTPIPARLVPVPSTDHFTPSPMSASYEPPSHVNSAGEPMPGALHYRMLPRLTYHYWAVSAESVTVVAEPVERVGRPWTVRTPYGETVDMGLWFDDEPDLHSTVLARLARRR